LDNEGTSLLGGLVDVVDRLANSKRIIISACGTSWHAGLIGEYMFEQFCGIPTEVEYASEFRYRNPIINKDDAIFFISQSGETADTLAALKEAKLKNAFVLGICNAVGSSIARETNAGVYTHAGPEIGVASTKAFTSQLVVLSLITLLIARRKKLSLIDGKNIVEELKSIPEKIEAILNLNDHIENIAEEFKDSTNFLYLGRGYNFPVALEGALKLKEISYIHAEGYPAAEMKHGPIALIDENMPVVFIAPKDSTYDKIISNIQEVKARGGRIIAIANEDDNEIDGLVDYSIKVPQTIRMLMPILTVIPLQLLAYHIAVKKGLNVDQPRNLAKSVTVE
jgi:glucosamine--fructose-6-phosphate aminotransferase (isomerizing)